MLSVEAATDGCGGGAGPAGGGIIGIVEAGAIDGIGIGGGPGGPACAQGGTEGGGMGGI